ncbi:class I SAM-dependent methyltransferase [Chamaesiphon minutus]|uniref:Methylase involved in ubiquinone/menaquinone biosynthesis n=1 Tax=Chamaesiphon minutus (strain ATCC 27169 / PCC 6605) TaxID=1173020 RepID=K9UIM9_CHAP6|nr:class I SAM-dependent methyltransferase [Chamaesiphon minutus]AFY94665.1 methylase involved in ubiquinone/menaquinone biosynthesis [Chamaesiphon minutus PCC 6605]
MKCNICKYPLEAAIFYSQENISITSLCEVYPQKTEVFFCKNCGHSQTTPLSDIDKYYDLSYKILIETEEEDQLYQTIDGHKKYRIDHQVETLLTKVNLPKNAQILDYGCAKSSIFKKLVKIRTDLTPHLFDVSEMYIPFWDKFVHSNNWATYTVKPEWDEYFDLVTSFFALEHVTKPEEMLTTIERLLKPGGVFYGIVPNTYTNIADFIVIDHVNHFSQNSLEVLLKNTGFEAIHIDPESHNGAFIVTAKKRSINKSSSVVSQPSQYAISDLEREVTSIAEYWYNITTKIRYFEAEHSSCKFAAIYGSGFYGTFIATCLENLERVECFIDLSPYRQGKYLLEKPILSPQELNKSTELVYVGLNPQGSSRSIAEIDNWHEYTHEYFYL